MSRRRRAGIVGLVAGLAAAGVATGMAAERRLVKRGRAAGASTPFGSLRGEPHPIVASDGLVLHAEVDNADEKASPGLPTIVFVHGYALNLDCWHYQRAALRGTHRLVFYDQRSHGRSARSRVEHCNVDQMGADLLRVIETLAPDGPVVLVGHSMGGMTIMALAADHPELFGTRVVGVGLASTSAGGLDTRAFGAMGLPGRFLTYATPALLATLARIPGVVERGRRAGTDIAFAATRRLAFSSDVSDELVDFTDEMLSATPFDVVMDFFPGLSGHDRYAAVEAFGWVPTVVVCGDNDAITPVGHSRRIAELVPSAELVVIENCGHMVLLEYPDLVVHALDRMIARAEGAEPA